MATVSYSIITSEEKNYLESWKTLIEEGEQLYQLHKEKSEPEEKLQENVGQLKRKQIHIEQLRDHSYRLNFAYEKKARYTPKKASPSLKSFKNQPRLIPSNSSLNQMTMKLREHQLLQVSNLKNLTPTSPSKVM